MSRGLLGREDVPWVGAQHPGAAQLHMWHLFPWKTKVLLYGTMQREMRQTELLPEGQNSSKHHLTQKGDKTGGCEDTNHDPA